MSQKRMFSLQIVDTDAFLEMPMTTQLLYFHLAMRADDEGFVGSPKKIIKVIGSNEDDFKILLAKRFLLAFESGVVVIKHWLIHNTIRMDRFSPTSYQEEKSLITTKENKSYTELATNGQPNGNQRLPQVKLSKVKLSKEKEAGASPAPLKGDSFFKKNKLDGAMPMDLAQFVLMCRGSMYRNIRIIGEYADERKYDYTTRGQWREFGLRNMRVAKRLAPYTERQMMAAADRMMKDLKENGGFITTWSLETVEKYLEQVNANN